MKYNIYMTHDINTLSKHLAYEAPDVEALVLSWELFAKFKDTYRYDKITLKNANKEYHAFKFYLYHDELVVFLDAHLGMRLPLSHTVIVPDLGDFLTELERKNETSKE